MAFRFSLRPPSTLGELFERVRELLPQIEVKVLASREIGTSETPIAHGLKSVPIFVRTSNPHCIAVIRKTKNPDANCVYFRATNPCVADIWVVAIGSIGRRQIENGGYHYPDWDPQGDALGDHKFSVDAADETALGYDYAETKIIAGTGGRVTKTTGSHGKALAVGGTLARNADATATGGLMDKTIDSDTITRELVTDGGVEKVKFNAVATRPEKIRYYLSDTHGTGDWTGHLLLTTNPYEEGSAIDLTAAANLSQFVSSPGSPGSAVWPGGSVQAHLRIKLTGARVGRTYKLYTGNRDIVYTSLIGDWTSGDVYQTAPYADQPAVTETYATLDFAVPVATLTAGVGHRFDLKLILRAYVGASEDGLDGEQLVIRVGGTDASYLDTLFTPSGGFAGEHNDLDGRSDYACHPASSISTAISAFAGNLSNSDTDVQKALDTLSKRESARYYLTGSYASPVLSRFPSASTWNSGAVSITTVSTMLLQASSAGWDPGLVVIDRGHCLFKVDCSATVDAKLHLEVKVGSATIAVSPWVPVAASGPTKILAKSVSDAPFASSSSDNVTVELLAATVSGSGTITLYSGGISSGTLVCPWQSDIVDTPYDYQCSAPGHRVIGGETLWFVSASRSLLMLSDLISVVIPRAETVSTGSVTWPIKKCTVADPSGTTIGSINFTAGNRPGSITFDQNVMLDAGDWCRICNQDSPDATVGDVHFTIPMVRAR